MELSQTEREKVHVLVNKPTQRCLIIKGRNNTIKNIVTEGFSTLKRIFLKGTRCLTHDNTGGN